MKLAAALMLSVATLATAPALASTYAQTKYPLVLVHGMGGFGSIGPVDYWYGMPKDLRDNGASVHVPVLSGFESSEVRGEQLLAQVQGILAITGAAKVNLIGHSHGNTAVRYVAGVLPSRVASVTSVGGPVKGAPAADLLKQGSELALIGAPLTSLITSVVDGIGKITDMMSGQSLSQDSFAGLMSLTTAGSADFNRRFPAGVPASACGEGDYIVNGIRYYSWSGISPLTSVIDPSDAAMSLTSLSFLGQADSQNDGLVGRCSSHLGKVIRDNYLMNHYDEVNQVFGLVSLLGTNPKSVLRQHANRLKLAGL